MLISAFGRHRPRQRPFPYDCSFKNTFTELLGRAGSRLEAPFHFARFLLVGQQAQMVHTCRMQIVHHIHHPLIMRALHRPSRRPSCPTGWPADPSPCRQIVGRHLSGIRIALPSRVHADGHRVALPGQAWRWDSWSIARCTLTPLDNIGVMTMKMISSTSITSTMGVTLMSATAPPLSAFHFSVIQFLPDSAGAGSPCGLPGNSTRRILLLLTCRAQRHAVFRWSWPRRRRMIAF